MRETDRRLRVPWAAYRCVKEVARQAMLSLELHVVGAEGDEMQIEVDKG